MKRTIIRITFFMMLAGILWPLRPGFGQGRTEAPDRRTFNSKTYHNADGTVTTEVSPGLVHYRDNDGHFKDIDHAITSSTTGGYDYEVTRGLYHAYFKSDLSADDPVAFETKGGVGLLSKLWGVAYLDIVTKNYHVLQQTQPTTAQTSDNTIYYENAFTNVHVKYSFLDARLKEDIFLTQAARDNLPDPSSFGLNPQDTYLVFITRLHIDLPTVSPHANNVNIRQVVYEGEDRIEFKDLRGRLKFFFPVDVAFHEDSSGVEDRIEIRKRIITQNGNRFLLSGVPLSWVQNRPPGTIIFDPQVEIQPDANAGKDAYITEANNNTNFGAEDNLIIGNDSRRSLIQFDLSQIPVQNITSAELSFYVYINTFQGSPNVYVHGLTQDWTEGGLGRETTGVTWNETTYNGVDWNTPGGDYEATASGQSAVTDTGWVDIDVTSKVQDWLDNGDNFGFLLKTDENSPPALSEALLFRSSDLATYPALRPKLVVTYVEPDTMLTIDNDQVIFGDTAIFSQVHSDYRLSVEGKIVAKEVVAAKQAWADYVFEEGYDLMSLEALEQSVRQNRRLPGIPSEKEVVAQGADLAEIQMKLLEKIEELTLYLIAQNKKIDQRQEMLEDMREQNRILKNRLEKFEKQSKR